MITQRVDAVTKIDKAHLGELIPAPPAVKIELTARCDMKCAFCATSRSLRKKGDMNFSFLEKILKQLKECGVREIGLFYLGESLLYSRLAEAIKLAKELKFEYVFLTTNGRTLTKEKAHSIISAGLDSLKFSFNSANRKQYKEIMGRDAFDKVIENIKNTFVVRAEVFRKTGHWCGLYASSIHYDDEQVRLMKDAIDRIKDSIDEHYWLPLYNQAGLVEGKVGGNPGRIGALRETIPCWVLFMEGHITWTGMLTGCSFSHEPQWDLGDLTKMDFMDAWNSSAAQMLRKAHLAGNIDGTACERCAKI